MHKYSWSRGPAMACRGILQWNWRGALVLLCIALAWPSLAHAADCPNFNVPDSHTMPSTSPMASGGTITIDASSCDPTGGIAGIEGIFSAPSHGTASVDAVAETVTYTNNGDGATTDSFTFGDPDSNAITVTVSIVAATSPITVTPASLPTPQVGVAYPPVTLSASGGTGPYTYTQTGGSLPPGMNFTGGSSGTFSGMPTHWANYSVSIEVADSAGHSTTKSYALDVPQPTITLSSLPSPAVGVSYNQTITASGGTSPYGNFSVSSGSLPPNLSLSSSGVLSGTPTTAGTYHFVVQAADSSAPTTYYGTHTYDLTVNNATVPGAPTIGTATAGNALAHVSFSPPASNGGAAISSYTAISHPGNLSGNCTSSPCTVNGLTNGTAYTFTVTATNAVGTGAASSASNSVTPSTVPDAPTGVAAASTTSAQATVTFNAAIDNGSAITGYAVTSSPAGGIDANAGTTSLSHVMTGLANGVLYTFTVTATNANGAGPASSPSNSVMPKAAQTITFANPGTQNFGTTPTLTASATSGLTVTFTSTTTTVCTISSGGALAFIAAGTCTIDANQAGNGAYAAAPQVSQSFTVNGILPGAPIIGTATGSDQQATVNFTPPASSGGSPIVGYTATSSSGGNTGTCAASPCTVAGLVNGTSYTFTVTATNGVGTGAASAASNSVIPLGIPTASAKSATATYNTATTIDLTSSITGADITGITVGSGPSHGTATVSGETVTYTPAPSYYGSDSFTYTATNAAGTSTPATVTITVSPAPPSNLAYSPANYFFTKGQASTTATPTYDGTPLTGCTVSPALPTGLSIDTGNCEISGTPTSLSTAPIVYTVTASNPAGSTTAMVTITVNDVAPSNLVYTPGSYTFTQGQAITPATPTYVGGSMTSCTASPALPAGLSISPGNCTISGTPTVSAPSSSYTVIASNSGGSTTAMVTINVLPTAPTVANTSATAAYNTAATIDLTSSITGADITGITVGSGPLHGTTTVSGKTVTYTPSPTYYGGSDSFTYTATNPGGTSTPATVTITVTPPPAPTVANASMTAAYNTTATIDLTSSITGADVTGITVGSGPSHGTVTISGKTVTYTPSSSYYGGSDSFTYTATNPGGTSAPATVSITVGVPAAPTVVAKSVATAYNTPATIDLTGSITGVGITAVTIGMAPAHGTVSVSGETVTYTPSPTYYGGSDSFTYTATNPGGTSAPATVTISVSAPAAPVVTPKSVTTAYNTAASIDLTSSITGVDITAVTIGTAPTHGTVSVSGKVVTYTPSATYYGGADSFTYTATNPGGTSSPATVSITVGAPAAPVVAAKPVTTAYNTAASIDLSGSITGVDITAVTIGTAPTHGTVSVSGKVVTYTPSSTYYGGSDSFTYTATNPGGTSTPATVTISVGAPAAPVVTAKSVTTAYNTAATIDLTGSITGVDITGVTIGTAPAHGSVSVSGETVTYTPSATYYGGMDSFTYTATNPGGTSAPATVTITVGAPAAPVVAAKSVSTAYNTAASIDLSGSITGVDITAVTIGTTPLHGTVSVSGKTVTYTPSATYYGGSDSFTYSATNPGGTSSPATVTLTVGVPAAPTVAAKSVSTAYNTAATIDLTGSITGVDITDVTIGTAPTHGTVSVSGKTVTYTPSSSYYGGSDSFTYTATNPGGTSSPATVSITVGAPAAPVVAAKPVTTAYNTAASIDLSGSITGVDITVVTIGTAPTHGTVSVSGKVVTYTPSATYYGGTDSFTYTATNPGGTSSPATVTITVGVPAAPTVAAKSISTAYNTAATIDLTGSITGVDITGVTIGTAPTHGTVSVSGKTVTYTPSSSYYGGSDSFTYTATNPGGTSAPAIVSITVGLPAAPTVAAKNVTTVYNTPASIDLSGAITGVDITSVAIASAPSHGTVSVSGKTVTYTPSSTYYGGTDSFTYTATNPGGTSTPATVTMTVTPLSVPTAQALSVTTTTGASVQIQATAGATGPAPFTGVSVAQVPAHGQATASGEQLTYTPATGFTGTDHFTYRIANHFGQSAAATVTVTVTAAGQASAPDGTVTLTTKPNAPVTTNLGNIVPGSFVSSTVLGLSPGGAGQVSISQPTSLTFTSVAGFHGLAQITVLLTAADGHTATVDVLVLVSNQPDPSKNPDVLGLVNAQAMEAQRFAQSQLDNIRQRLESLHDGNQQLFSSTLSMSLNGKPLQGPRMAGAGRLPGQQPGNDTDHPNGLAATTQPDGPMTMRPGIGSAGDNMMMMSDAAMPTSDSTGTSGGHAPPSRGPNGLAAWIDGTAAFGSYDSYRQAAGFDANSIAINTGIDQRVGERGLFGISLGYNHDQSTVANDGTRSIARGYSAAIYGSFAPSAKTYIDAVLGGGGLSFDSRRRDSNDGSYLLGHRNGNQWFGSLTAGYEYHHQRWMISPYGRLEWSYSALNGFAENGDVADALTYGRQNIRTSLAVLGVRTSGLIVTTHAVLVPRARLEIGHEFQGTSDTTLSYAFVPSAGSWNVLSNPYSANGNSVQAGLGLDIQLPRSLTLTTDYSFLMQPHSHSQMIRFGLNKKF